MLSLVIIGTGNVATHLYSAFLNTEGVIIKQVFGRNQEHLKYFSERSNTTSIADDIIEADIYLVAVSDNAIEPVSQTIPYKKGIVAHTSGSVPMSEILHQRKGVFYPLQTFTKDKEINFEKIPICIEAHETEDLILLKHLAGLLSGSVYEVRSEQRKKLHLAAVFANNFSNHLFQIAKEICEKEMLPFELLRPLIIETAEKLRNLDPKDAQTGPARRNDLLTMQKHLEELDNPLHKKIYQLLSESIKETYEKEL